MYWADKIAKNIIDSGKFTPYWVDDMKTPSGFAHVGSLRGPIIHSLIHRALKDAGKEVTFTFCINDFDAVDELTPELKESFKEYMGLPLKKAPSPDTEHGSLADYYADDFNKAITSLGAEPKILSSWEMYHEGKFDGVIKEALDNAEKIQEIYQKISGSDKKTLGWLPLQVICEKCGKLGTTRVFAWDGDKVSYKCEPSLVAWAQGCGNEGKISPFGGNGKLPWKIDWAAHWKVVGVTIEGAGKDHASAGGSYDIAMELCKEVFNYPQPYKLPYEFFLFGGKKMSSSKGLGLKAHDLTSVLPPELGRFLFARGDYREQINFNLEGTMDAPDLFDEYDECYKIYCETPEEDLGRAFILSQIKSTEVEKGLFLPRFRDVAQMLQIPGKDLVDSFAEKKGSELSEKEKEILEERIKYAKVWLEKFAPDEFKTGFVESIPEVAKSLDDDQKEYLVEVIKLLDVESDPEKLQVSLYSKSKEMGIDTKKAFAAIYLTLIGKQFGPKAAWFLLSLPKEKIIERFKEVIK